MKKRLTFVSFDAYPLLDVQSSGGIGGAEVRAVTFAKELKRRDEFELDFVVSAEPETKRIASGFPIRTYSKQRPPAFQKLLQSISKRILKRPPADKFFESLETDALLCFGVRNDTAGIIRAAEKSNRKSILFLTSDRNVEDALRKSRRDRGVYGEIGHLCRYALEHADAVVAQTSYQRSELKNRLGVDGHLIRNPICLSNSAVQKLPTRAPTVLWVGRADTFSKRADLGLEVARRCPDIRFRMVMNNHDSNTFNKLSRAASSNVEIIERVPFSEIESYFASSTLLINTSSAEGFPNSFLQAAKYGKPIVSLAVDPGEVLSRFRCGSCADGDIDRMSKEVVRLCFDELAYADVSKRAFEYVNEYHAAEARANELVEVIHQLWSMDSETKLDRSTFSKSFSNREAA